MPSKIFEPLRNILLWIKHCAVCESPFPPSLWLCRSCLKRLQSFYLNPNNMMRMQSSFRHLRLIDWTSENGSFIKRVIDSLKGETSHLFFEGLAKEFTVRINYLVSVQKDSPFIFIPCPSKTQADDHSVFWSQALSRKVHFPVQNVLKHIDLKSVQKRKTLFSRSLKNFTLKQNFSLKSKTPIFTDDVLTSGATAKAAYKALGSPPSFMVWSIFWRKK